MRAGAETERRLAYDASHNGHPPQGTRQPADAHPAAQPVNADATPPSHREALTDLRNAVDKLAAACMSCPDQASIPAGRYLSPGEAASAAARLIAGAQHVVHAVAGQPDPLGLLAPGPLHDDAASRQVAMKIICNDGMRADTAGARALRQLAQTGAHIATAPAPPPPVVIADHNQAIMTVPDRDEPGEWLIVTGPPIAGYLAAAIEAFWIAATPLHLAIPADGNGISPADVVLLRLLATGITQQDTARRLHISERTISRRVADLKQRLDATSAMQAGLEAARRGLI